MARIVCHVIAYVQIMSAGYNLWGVDPRILINLPFGRNTFMIGLFMVVQILGLAGAIMMLQQKRLGYVLSIAHHFLLMPALVITTAGLVVLMDDRLNLTLLFMSQPDGWDIGLYWSLGWNTVFQQVTRNVPTGSTYFGINLFAVACAYQLWVAMAEADGSSAPRDRQMRRGQRRPELSPLALPEPDPMPVRDPYPQEPRTRPKSNPRPQRSSPPPSDWDF